MYHWLYAGCIRGTSQTSPASEKIEKQGKRRRPLQKLIRCNKEIAHTTGKDAAHGNSLLVWRCAPLCALGRDGWHPYTFKSLPKQCERFVGEALLSLKSAPEP